MVTSVGDPMREPALDAIWALLAKIPDPEIPVISIVELGIVRNVAREGNEIVVTVTPTYSGCPATEMIATDIRRALAEAGVRHCRMQTQLSPAWTTDWIAPEARARLRGYGIVPPAESTASRLSAIAIDITGLRKRSAPAVACPRCGSTHTQELSRFGSTPCKAQYRCDDCREPFDYFKPH